MSDNGIESLGFQILTTERPNNLDLVAGGAMTIGAVVGMFLSTSQSLVEIVRGRNKLVPVIEYDEEGNAIDKGYYVFTADRSRRSRLKERYEKIMGMLSPTERKKVERSIRMLDKEGEDALAQVVGASSFAVSAAKDERRLDEMLQSIRGTYEPMGAMMQGYEFDPSTGKATMLVPVRVPYTEAELDEPIEVLETRAVAGAPSAGPEPKRARGESPEAFQERFAAWLDLGSKSYETVSTITTPRAQGLTHRVVTQRVPAPDYKKIDVPFDRVKVRFTRDVQPDDGDPRVATLMREAIDLKSQIQKREDARARKKIVDMYWPKEARDAGKKPEKGAPPEVMALYHRKVAREEDRLERAKKLERELGPSRLFNYLRVVPAAPVYAKTATGEDYVDKKTGEKRVIGYRVGVDREPAYFRQMTPFALGRVTDVLYRQKGGEITPFQAQKELYEIANDAQSFYILTEEERRRLAARGEGPSAARGRKTSEAVTSLSSHIKTKRNK